MTKYDGGAFSCADVVHNADTPRTLANAGGKSSGAETRGLMPAGLKAAAPGGVFPCNYWHRYGWHTGKHSHGGCRLGFSCDIGAGSDSEDSYMCVGATRGASGMFSSFSLPLFVRAGPSRRSLRVLSLAPSSVASRQSEMMLVNIHCEFNI